MAGSAGNLSHYDEVLKTYYLPGIQDYLNHDTILADVIETNEMDVSGKNATIECHYGRSTGTGARADGGALPSANYQRFKTCTVPMKYVYGRIEVTGPTIAATRDEKGAYAKALDAEVKGITNDLKNEVNRMLWGCGYGTLARWYSGGSGTSYVVQKKYRGNAAGGDGFGSAFGGKYLEKRGDMVAVVCASLSGSGTFTVDATNMAATAVTKTVATYDTITVTTDPSVSEAAGTFYVRPASLGTYAASGAHRYEAMGIRGLVTNTDLDEIAMTDGTNTGGVTNDPLQGLAVATYPWFKSIVSTHASGRYAGQRALTLKLMQTMFDMVEEQAGKDYGPNLMLTTRAIRREYLELVQGDRRFMNTMTLDGGWEALDYNGIPFTVDNDAIDGEIYFLTTRDLQLYRMSDYDWMQKDGAILSRISGYDTYEAVLYRYFEFGIKNRATQGVLCDLAYDKEAVEGYGR
uniref:Putative capsid protein n=1 Tax=viral metagenome TaxID=1070528 RepID=A0A6M3L6W5_9ZZZZ